MVKQNTKRKKKNEWMDFLSVKYNAECVSVRKTEPVINFCHQEYTC